jgi:hypothetical protein
MSDNHRRVTMYDSIDAAAVPDRAEAVAGYIDGQWPSYVHFPRNGDHKWIVSIATSWQHLAMVLDVESGDATNAQAASWLSLLHRHGMKRPCLYTSLQNIPPLVESLRIRGHPRRSYRLWSAHWTDHAHVCTAACLDDLGEPPGATQYANLQSADLDVTLTHVWWLNALVDDYRRAAGIH